MSKLTLVIGLPGSGKTTFTKEKLRGVKLHVDEIRKSLTGSYKPDNNNKFIHNITLTTVEFFLNENKNVIVDAALLSVKNRKEYIKLAKKYNCNIDIYLIDPEHKKLIENIKKRNKESPIDRIIDSQYLNKMEKYLETPTEEEGFNKIFIINEQDI